MTKAAEQMEVLSRSELLSLCAADTAFYGRQFFPQACRQVSPDFHREMYQAIDSPEERYVAAMIYRGGAKTTCVRIALSKRIAFAISRTILLVGKSESAAAKSLSWLKRNVQHNSAWAEFFGLERGKVWRENHIEIVNKIEGVTITIIAMGIGGSVRGVNIDDYRPDFILVDDPCDEENTGTPEQREKTSDLFFGSLARSLAPVADNPYSKMALLQTPLAKGDLIDLAANDPQWYTLVYSCFTDDGESRWPERQGVDELMQEKEGYRRRNQMSLWLREMECKIVSRETAAFLPEWLERYHTPPGFGFTLVAVDPTPPPRPGTVATARHDEAVILILRFSKGKVYILDGYSCKTPDPLELCVKIIEMAVAFRAQAIAVETILFARVLSSVLRRVMFEQRRFIRIIEVEDRRAKQTRIRDEISVKASNNVLMFPDEIPGNLEEQFLSYPDVNHDDWLDALAIGLTAVSPQREQQYIDGEYSVIEDEDPEPLEGWQTCP